MPRKNSQLDERAKLKRDLEGLIALRKCVVEHGVGSEQYCIARDKWLKKWLTEKRQLSAANLKRRHKAWIAAGSPELHSPEWQAELERLRALEPKRKLRRDPPNTDPHERNSLYWQYMLRAALIIPKLDAAYANKRAPDPADLIALPAQNYYNHTKEQRTEARRMYRWLWRTFPGLLRACTPGLRKLIRQAGGIA